MRLGLLSTYVDENAFAILCKQGKASNPSNQNFYGRFCRSLQNVGDVHLFSMSFETLKDNAPSKKFHYFLPSRSKLGRLADAKKIAKEVIAFHRKNPLDALFYDSLNLTLSKAASIIVKTSDLRVIAVVTDSPKNISFAPWYYSTLCLRNSRNASGYFCLTKELNVLFNPKKKPSYIQMGIVDEDDAQKEAKQNKPYIYYGGALFEKDGVGDLLRAYQDISPNFDIIISGHGPMEEELRQKNVKSLHFLGQISKEEHLALIKNAILVINPRRYNESLDVVSVPSKVLEYIALAPSVLSSLSTSIHDTFPDDINWLPTGGNNQENIKQFFLDHLDESGNFVHLKPNNAQSKIISILGVTQTGLALSDFIASIK